MKNPLIEKYGNDPRWVVWKLETVNSRETKVPYSVSGSKASSNNPETWNTYEKIVAVSNKVGIVFKEDKLLLGIDIDHCIENGLIVHEQKEIIENFIRKTNTYVEISPSGTGLHIFLILTESFSLLLNKKAPYEIYNSGRYFTVTGNSYKEDRPVRVVTPEEALRLLSILGYPWGKNMNKQAKSDQPTTMEDNEIIERMFNSKNGDKIKALYNGDITQHGNDDSSADMALCSHLAFWTGKNVVQIERIWVNSPLGAREKTQERKDYRDRTISNAIDRCVEVYKHTKHSEENLGTGNNDFRGAFKNCKSSDQTKAIIYKIARYLIDKYHIKSIKGRTREVFIYKDGIYIAGEDVLKKDIREMLQDSCTTYYSKEIIEITKDLTVRDRDDFRVDVDLINLNNGIWDIKNKILLSHDPQYLFFTKIPVDYNPSVDCPIIKGYLFDVLETEEISIIQEWFGYSLYREYHIKKAIIFVGDGDTGKTTLINLFYSFLGSKNIAGVSLQKMSSDKFACANLYNKHINLYDDLSFKDIKDNGSFKIATGGGYISAEKKFGDQFLFKNYAKLAFACNKIPDVKDSNDEAYFNRWIVIEFNRVIEEENKDKQLGNRMATSEELSGLLNFALEGLDRLLKNQSFSYDMDTNETKLAMMRSGSSIARFAFDSLEEVNGEWISKDDMYQAFVNYTQINKIPATSMKTFGGRLPICVSYIAEFKPKDLKTGKQITAWRNVRLNKTMTDILSQLKNNTQKVESNQPISWIV